jgi:succinate dehydrogenase / fumarate reductase cytochrome b subunit
MTRRRSVFHSSIVTKLIIGLTGFLLFLYLILHLAGNVLVFFGPEIFNSYSHQLISNPLVVPVEIGLLVVFLIHVFRAIQMTLANRRARPTRYMRKERAGGASRKSVASSTMIVSGLALLMFIPVHVRMFKYGAHYDYAGLAGGPVVRDLYRLEMEIFRSPLTAGAYVAAMVLVGMHLWHGTWSAFQSLGLEGPRFTPFVSRLGKLSAVVIAGGFIAIAVWAFLQSRPL